MRIRKYSYQSERKIINLHQNQKQAQLKNDESLSSAGNKNEKNSEKTNIVGEEDRQLRIDKFRVRPSKVIEQ